MPCPEFLRGSGQVLSTAAMPQTNHTRTAGPGLTTTRFADNHHIYRRLGAREPRAGRLRRGTPFGTAPQGAVAGIPPDDQQPHGAHGRLRGARGAQVRRVGRHRVFRFEIRRGCRDERLGLRLGEKQFAGKKNPDLWMRFLRVYRHHNVRFVWVKGHADTVENNRCDQLAVAAANDKAHLLEDTGYEP